MSEWISIKDKKPEKAERILFICDGVQSVLMGIHISGGSADFNPMANRVSFDQYTVTTKIKKWMPLPEFTKELNNVMYLQE